MLLQALCIIWYPLVDSNWSYSPETPNLGQIRQFYSRVTLKFDRWPSKTIGHLFYATSSCVHHFVAIGEFKLELQSGNAQSGSNSTIFRKRDLQIWHMTLKNNRAPLISNIKLYASSHHHMWIQTGVTVRKRLSWVVTSVTLTFDLWPWPFAWTLLLSLVITPENLMMIRWWEHSQKGVTGGPTDRRTENKIHRATWSQLKYFIIWCVMFDDAYQQNRKHAVSCNINMIHFFT